MKFDFMQSLFLILLIIPSVCYGQNVSPTSDADIIENYLNNLDKGKLIYEPPQKMTVNLTEIISAMITKENISIGEDIEVAPYMYADLKGGAAFEITDYVETDQVIPNEGNATWKWDVKPRVVGIHSLDLLLYISIPLHNDNKNRVLIHNKTIQIEVNPKEIRQQEEISERIFRSNIYNSIKSILAVLGSLGVLLAGIFREDIRKLATKWNNKRKNTPKRKK